MKKLTKIVATIGPSTESEEMIETLIKTGVNVFRFNLKHSDLSWHGERIQRVQDIAQKLNKPIATLIDLQGPEIRITVPSGEFSVANKDIVTMTKVPYDEPKSFTISHPYIIDHLKPGTKIYIEDGRFEFTVKEVVSGKGSHGLGDRVVLESHSKGVVKNRKSMNIPGVYFPLPALTERDLDALKMAKKYNVTYVALSFVRQEKDVLELREHIEKLNFNGRIVAKIETKMAIDHLDEIIAASDALMVARGDLGIELPIEEVPHYQKIMIRKCIEGGIPVITATQMLESMIENPFATRAEISDIANAVYDYTDAVMLSGETANGAYPLETVQTMVKTIKFTESKNAFDTRSMFSFSLEDQEDIIADAAYNLSRHFPGVNDLVDGFILFSQTGRTAKKVSRYHATIPVYAFVPDLEHARYLSLNFGIIPIVQPEIFKKGKQVEKEDIVNALDFLKKQGYVDSKKYYILLHGDQWMVEGKTSTIKIIAPSE